MGRILQKLTAVASTISVDASALSSLNAHVSYAELILKIRHCMQWLQSIDAHVVALQADNSIDWVVTDLACQELALVFIPLPAFFTQDQIQHCLSSAGVNVVLSDQATFPGGINTPHHPVTMSIEHKPSPFYAWKRIDSSVQQIPEKTQKITFTSGSTGDPKGVCLSLDHQWHVAQSLTDAIAIKSPTHLCLLPLSTLLENIAGVYACLLSGGEVVIPSDLERGLEGSSKVDAAALVDCIQNVQPTTLILVPQLLALLVHARMTGWQAPTRLKFIAVGGGKVSADLIRTARKLGLPVYQGYGLSECGSVVALNTVSCDQPDSVGQVLPHCRVSIENNEVVVSGSVHLGYLGMPDSWHPQHIYTGDVGTLKHGFLTIDGRSKNILISSFGRNISPEWVESVLMSAPMFNQCIVMGDTQPYLIALLTAPSTVTDNEITQRINSCNQDLPDYAKIGAWLRITSEQLAPHMTASGRPKRDKIQHAFSAQINPLYQRTLMSA